MRAPICTNGAGRGGFGLINETCLRGWTEKRSRPSTVSGYPRRAQIVGVTMEQLELGAPLGDGASGDVFASTFDGEGLRIHSTVW